MPTLTAGRVVSILWPTDGQITITPGNAGRVSLNARGRDGSQSIAPREIYIAETIAVSAGDTVILEAINTDAAYTTPVSEEGASVFSSGSSYAVLGDSHSEACTINEGLNPTTRGHWANGHLFWFLTHAGFRPGRVYNFGIGGETTAQVRARVGQVVAARPRVCIVMAGTNNADTATMVRQAREDLTAIYEALRGAGVFVIAMTPTPSDPAAASATKRARFAALGQWIMEYWAGRSDGLAVDNRAAVIDPATGTWRTGYNRDVTHLSNLGAFVAGKAISDAVKAKYPAIRSLVGAVDDSQAVDAASAYLATNPMLTGTSGSNFGSSSGQVATSWISDTTGGVSAVCSKTTSDEGFDEQTATITASAAGDYFFYQTITGLKAGRSYSATARIEFESATNMTELRAYQALPGATMTIHGAVTSAGAGNSALPSSGVIYPVVQWSDYIVPVDGSGQLTFRVKFSAAGGAVVRFSRVTVEPVV